MNSNEWIEIQGDKEQVIKLMQDEFGVNEKDAHKILYYLINEKNILCVDETIRLEKNERVASPDMLGLLIIDYNYYINVRVATVFVLSTLLDGKIQFPISSFGLAVQGMNKLIEKIDEWEGQKCILLELLRIPNKTGTMYLLDGLKKQCCNNHFKCKYKDQGNCKCTNNDVEEILKNLHKNGIVEKNDNEYKYSVFGLL